MSLPGESERIRTSASVALQATALPLGYRLMCAAARHQLPRRRCLMPCLPSLRCALARRRRSYLLSVSHPQWWISYFPIGRPAITSTPVCSRYTTRRHAWRGLEPLSPVLMQTFGLRTPFSGTNTYKIPWYQPCCLVPPTGIEPVHSPIKSRWPSHLATEG